MSSELRVLGFGLFLGDFVPLRLNPLRTQRLCGKKMGDITMPSYPTI